MSHGYDLDIKNARVFDGSGGQWYEADIAVRNGRIAGIGKVDASDAAQCVDAEGREIGRASCRERV